MPRNSGQCSSTETNHCNPPLHNRLHSRGLLPGIVVGSILLFAGKLQADWPEFRGPNQNGTVSTANLPATWSEKENVRWYTPTPGLGWSSPIIVGDQIFITTAVAMDGNDSQALTGPQTLQLVCLNAKSGEIVFQRTILDQDGNAPSIHKKNSHASPTILAYDGRLYVHFGHQGTICTDLQGKTIWSNRDHPYPPTHGNGGSPIIAEGKLIVTCDGGDTPYTLALDAKTGNELWKAPRGNKKIMQPFSFSTPQYIQVGGKGQIISAGSEIVQALSPDDGSVIWSVKYFGFSVIPRPVYYKNLVFVCTGYMTPKLLAIDPTGQGDVTKTHVKWDVSTGVPNTPSVIPCGDQIVMISDGGVASGVDIESGKKVWQKRLGGNYSASPLAQNNRVYFQGETGEAIILEVDKTAKEIGRGSLPGRIFASYAVIDDDLIIRAEQGIYRIGNSSK